jgi:hypothetical protein
MADNLRPPATVSSTLVTAPDKSKAAKMSECGFLGFTVVWGGPVRCRSLPD